MRRIYNAALLSIFLGLSTHQAFTQTCGTRQLDPVVAGFLKLIDYKDLSLEQLRGIPIEQIKFAGPPAVPHPKDDVRRIKITADSIPILVFNATHAHNIPIVINYHGGGFISPLLPGLEHDLWRDSNRSTNFQPL